MESTRAIPRSASTRSICEKRSSIRVRRSSADQSRPGGDGVRIAVEADHLAGAGGEDRAGIAARAERAVDHGVAALNGERGDDFVDQHRHMGGHPCTGAGQRLAPFSDRRKRAISFRSSGILGSARSRSGFQTWKVSPVPRNSARSSILPFMRIIGGIRIRPELS